MLPGENIYADHGRGIYLINRMMDAVEFKNTAPRSTCAVLGCVT